MFDADTKCQNSLGTQKMRGRRHPNAVPLNDRSNGRPALSKHDHPEDENRQDSRELCIVQRTPRSFVPSPTAVPECWAQKKEQVTRCCVHSLGRRKMI